MLSGPSPLIALINDERRLLVHLTRACEEQGLRVLWYKHGTQALRDPHLRRAELLVSDWTNPPLHGQGLWDALRERGLLTPVLFASPWAAEIEAQLGGSGPRLAGTIESLFSAAVFVTTIKRELLMVSNQAGARLHGP